MQPYKCAALAAAIALSSFTAVAGQLPDIRVGPFNFNEAPIHVALTKIVRGTGISVVMAEDVPGTLTATEVEGKLEVILGKVCGYSGAKCDFDNGVLMVSMRSHVAASPQASGVAATPDVDAAEAKVVTSPEPPKPWGVVSGTSLRSTLADWSTRAGWELHWDATDDFVLLARAEFNGDFDGAVSRLLTAVNAHGHAFQAETYAGNKVLRVFK